MLTSATHQPAVYMRYIDDIFGIGIHGPDNLDRFLDHLNNFHPLLQFSVERSDRSAAKQIPFLDTLLTLNENGSLTTELYIKPMASSIILPYSSAQPIQTKRAVLHAQLLRAKRPGSSIPPQDRGMQKIESLFLSNGYPSKLINKTKFTVKTQNPRQLDKHVTSKQSNRHSDATYISLSYIDDTLSRKIDSVIKRSKLPVRIAWQSGQTLSEKLTSSALEKTQCPSGNKKCNCCSSGLKGKCHTKNAVYMITCNLCTNKQTHIGESKRSVGLRFNEHMRDAKNKNKTKNTPFGEHFMKCHSNS